MSARGCNGLIGIIACLTAAATPALAQDNQPYAAVEEVYRASETVIGEPLAYPRTDAEVRALIVTLVPGEATEWHTHGVPLFAYVLEGELTVEYEGHGVRFYRPGEALLEAMTAMHQGRNQGTQLCRILAVYKAGDGLPLSHTR